MKAWNRRIWASFCCTRLIPRIPATPGGLNVYICTFPASTISPHPHRPAPSTHLFIHFTPNSLHTPSQTFTSAHTNLSPTQPQHYSLSHSNTTTLLISHDQVAHIIVLSQQGIGIGNPSGTLRSKGEQRPCYFLPILTMSIGNNGIDLCSYRM